MARMRLGELLVQAGAIDEIQLRSALGEQKKWGNPLGRTLIEMRLIDEPTLVTVLSRQLNIQAVDLARVTPQREALALLPYEFCLENGCIPFAHMTKGNFLDVAMSDPTNPVMFDKIRVATRCNVRPHLAGPFAIDAAIRHCYLGHNVAGVDVSAWMPPRAGEQVFEMGGLTVLPSRELKLTQLTADAPSPAAASAAVASHNHAPLTEELQRLADDAAQLRALIERDEKVIRRLMALLVEKGVCTKQELVARINKD